MNEKNKYDVHFEHLKKFDYKNSSEKDITVLISETEKIKQELETEKVKIDLKISDLEKKMKEEEINFQGYNNDKSINISSLDLEELEVSLDKSIVDLITSIS